MTTSRMTAMSALPKTRSNLTLSDLALDAAVELERFQTSGSSNLQSVRDLASALSERGLTDLALVPVYDRALARGGSGSTSRNDLYSRLTNIMQKLQEASTQDIDVLRDFCVALHDALLTKRLQSLRPPVLTQRRLM